MSAPNATDTIPGFVADGIDPESFDLTASQIDATLHRVCGGFQGRFQGDETSSLLTYSANWKGTPIQLAVQFDPGAGKVRFGIEAEEHWHVLPDVMAEITSTKLRTVVVAVHVSLGFKRLAGPLELGSARLAPLAHKRPHGMRVSSGGVTAGDVTDHVLAFPVRAYDWGHADVVAEKPLKFAVALAAFALDFPIAAFGEASAVPEGMLPNPGSDVGVRLEFEGCDLAAEEADGGGGLDDRRPRPMPGHAEFVRAVFAMEPERRERMKHAIRSYHAAMLVAEPEPGFERYEDTTVAVTLWLSIMEGLAPKIESTKPKCEACGREFRTSVNETVEAYAITLRFNPEDVERWRKVRNTLAHTGIRQLNGEENRRFHALLSPKARKQHKETSDAVRGSRALARKAILEFAFRPEPEPVVKPVRPHKPRPEGVAEGVKRTKKKSPQPSGCRRSRKSPGYCSRKVYHRFGFDELDAFDVAAGMQTATIR